MFDPELLRAAMLECSYHVRQSGGASHAREDGPLVPIDWGRALSQVLASPPCPYAHARVAEAKPLVCSSCGRTRCWLLSGGFRTARVQAEPARVKQSPQHTAEAVSFRMPASRTRCGRAGAACAALHRAAHRFAVSRVRATGGWWHALLGQFIRLSGQLRHVPSFGRYLCEFPCAQG